MVIHSAGQGDFEGIRYPPLPGEIPAVRTSTNAFRKPQAAASVCFSILAKIFRFNLISHCPLKSN